MNARRPIAELRTHEVTNQPPPFEDFNLFTSDRALVDAVKAAGGAMHLERLTALGARADRPGCWRGATRPIATPPCSGGATRTATGSAR